MASSSELILYTRPGCHLCEQVVLMLQALDAEHTPVDIESDPGLEEKYGLHIPVLRLTENGRELFFPFDRDRLAQFLEGKI
jgi:glutaredoxin